MTGYARAIKAATRMAKHGNSKASDTLLWRAVTRYATEQHVNMPKAVQYVTEYGAELFWLDGVHS